MGELPPWYAVERRHEEVGDGEVEEEVVGDAPHGAVRQDDPQDHRVPHDCNHNDHSEEESPDDLLIPPGILLKTPSNVLSTVLTKTHFGSHRYKVKDIILKGSGFGMIYEKYHGVEHSERHVIRVMRRQK